MHQWENSLAIFSPIRTLGPIWNIRAQGMPATVPECASIEKFLGNFFTDTGSDDLVLAEGFPTIIYYSQKATWYRLRDYRVDIQKAT